MLIAEGDHVPVTPLVDVVANVGAVLPEHRFIDEPKVNDGVSIWLTVTINVAVVTHWPGTTFGVNVYTPDV